MPWDHSWENARNLKWIPAAAAKCLFCGKQACTSEFCLGNWNPALPPTTRFLLVWPLCFPCLYFS